SVVNKDEVLGALAHLAQGGEAGGARADNGDFDSLEFGHGGRTSRIAGSRWESGYDRSGAREWVPASWGRDIQANLKHRLRSSQASLPGKVAEQRSTPASQYIPRVGAKLSIYELAVQIELGG